LEAQKTVDRQGKAEQKEQYLTSNDPCFLSFVEYRTDTNISNIMRTDHVKGDHIQKREGKRRKLRR
jgi:hypothetical protein